MYWLHSKVNFGFSVFHFLPAGTKTNCNCLLWAAWNDIWLLRNLAPKGVIFSSLFNWLWLVVSYCRTCWSTPLLWLFTSATWPHTCSADNRTFESVQHPLDTVFCVFVQTLHYSCKKSVSAMHIWPVYWCCRICSSSTPSLWSCKWASSAYTWPAGRNTSSLPNKRSTGLLVSSYQHSQQQSQQSWFLPWATVWCAWGLSTFKCSFQRRSRPLLMLKWCALTRQALWRAML